MNARSDIGKIAIFLLVATLLSSITSGNNYQTSAGVPQFPVASGSWNNRVQCSSPWIVRITDITDNRTGSASLTSSTFNPGITSPVGAAKRWLTPGSTPPGWVSPGPPCTITNSHGKVAVFVEIDGVRRGNSVSTEDCTNRYDAVNGGTLSGGTYCDETFNIYDPAVVPNYSTSCKSSTDPTCYGRIHSEIDHDWSAAKYCGASTSCDNVTLSSQTTTSTLIDVQGFISWDPGHLNETWHNLNGWEIHPLTGWRVHQANNSLTASFSFSPMSPTTGQTLTFTASASGGSPPYTFTWSFGDKSSATGNPVTHAYSTAGSYTIAMNASDSTGHTAASSQTITVTGDFKLTANPENMTILSGRNGQSQIAVTSLNGFQGTVSFTLNVSSPGLTISIEHPSVSLSAGQTQNDNLRISATITTPSGTYVVGIRGTSGLIVHSLNVAVTVPKTDFSLTANPDLLTVQLGQNSQSQIVVTSLSGFSGTVSFDVLASSPGLTLSMEKQTVNLSSGQRQNDNLRVSATNASPTGFYVLTVKATSGLLVHSVNVTVRVPDFNITSNPDTLSLSPGATGSSQITFQSLNGFQGGLNTQVSVSPAGPKVALNPNNPTLNVNGTITIVLSIQLASNQAPGVYNVTIKATAGALVHSIVIKVLVGQHTSSASVSCSPSALVVNEASTCTGIVNDTSTGSPTTPTGSVTFVETGPAGSFSPIACTLVSGSCSVTFAPTATGTASVTTVYAGDSTHSGSTSASAIVTVNLRTTSTTVVCSSPVVVNQPSPCIATVSDNSPGTVVTSTGNVSFTTNSTGIFSNNSCTLTGTGTSGVASCQVTYTPAAVGTPVITGSYSGDAIHLASQGTTSITFGRDSTATTVTCSPSSVVVNQTTTCAITVTDTTLIGATTPTGTASFASNGTGTFAGSPCALVSQNATSAGCQATYTPTSGAGTHTIKVTYSGDGTHNSSTSFQAFALTVTLRTTSTNISCTTPVAINQGSTCYVTVNDSSPGTFMTPRGAVALSENGVTGTFTTCTLAGTTALATCSSTFTATTSGIAGAAANYPGDSSHSSSSGATSIVVNTRATSTSVSCSPGIVVVNQATSCTAVVSDSSGSGGMTPSGNVTFAPSSSCTLANGSCSVSITPSASGSFGVSASYAGDSSHSSSSASTTVPVSNRATSTSISCSPSQVTINTATSCVVKVTDTDVGTAINPSGPVGFASNSTGVFAPSSCSLTASGTVGLASCSVNYTASVTGPNSITASYAGDSSHLVSSGNVLVTVVGVAPKPAYALVVSTDGKVSRLYQNGTLTLVGQPVTTPLRAVAWKPDGSYALISGNFAVLLRYNGTTLTTIPTGISTGYNFWTVSWKPDGSYALVGGSAGLLFKYDGVKVTIIPNTSATVFSITWNPSGSIALLAGRSGLVLTYDGTTIHSFTTGTTYDLDATAWNPNGTYALIGGLNRTLLHFNGTGIITIDTSIINPNNAIRAISFNWTGTMALLAGDKGMVLTYNGSTLTMLPTITSSPLYSISWSSSGTAYIAGNSGTILTYSNGSLTELSTTQLITSNFRGIAWTP